MGQLVTGQTTVNTTLICTSVQFYFVVTVTMAVADIPDDDLAGLQLKCNQVTDDSLESTRRMMNMCAEAKDAGIKSLVALDDQGEQLDKVEAGLDSINNDMGLAEKALKSMDLAFGIFPKFWEKLREEAEVALSLQLQLRLVRVLLLPESPMM